MNPQKIALVSDWFLPRTGGIERHLVDLARVLAARGRQVEIVTATPGSEVVPELPGVPVVRLDVPLLPGWQTVYRPRDGAALAELFAARGYDLIHAHSIYSPLALAATHAGRVLRVPTVLTAHSLVRYACIALFRVLDYRLMWSSWPQVITAVSEAVAADLRRASFAAEVQVLPNGLCLPPAQTHPLRRARDPFTIVCVSRLVARKRPLALLRAFARLRDRLGERAAARCRLVFLGGGPLYDELHELAGRLGVADRVELRGWSSPEEVALALTGADVFALPTRKEAFGLAALEAAAAGLPVVTLRGSGAAELFTPGVVGGDQTVDDAGVTDALARLVADPALCARLGERARLLAERFAWAGIIERTLQLYRLAAQRLGDRSGASLAPPLEPRPPLLQLVGRS
jgi:glycosyltransferase involved in cell wall biosynthesis